MIGKFIVFEGIDGSAKTTQIQLLKECLQQNGINSIITAEPSSSVIGTLIRDLQQGNGIQNPSDYTMALLYAADRCEHEKWIKSKIAEGIWVLCDRYKYSSMAYQEDIPDASITVEDLNEVFIEPDHAFLLNIPVAEALSRLSRRGGVSEIFEKEDILEAVSQNYKKIFTSSNPENFSIINAIGDKFEIRDNIYSILQRKYSL